MVKKANQKDAYAVALELYNAALVWAESTMAFAVSDLDDETLRDFIRSEMPEYKYFDAEHAGSILDELMKILYEGLMERAEDEADQQRQLNHRP